MKQLTITYPEELLLCLKESPDEFEAHARLLLAVKLYETGKITTGMAARLSGRSRAAFILELAHFGLSPVGTLPEDLSGDLANA